MGKEETINNTKKGFWLSTILCLGIGGTMSLIFNLNSIFLVSLPGLFLFFDTIFFDLDYGTLKGISLGTLFSMFLAWLSMLL